MKAPNIFLCSLHLLHAIMGLHIFSAGYAQLALSYCLVTSVSTRQTSLMQEVSSSSSVKQSRGILLLQAQVSYKSFSQQNATGASVFSSNNIVIVLQHFKNQYHTLILDMRIGKLETNNNYHGNKIFQNLNPGVWAFLKFLPENIFFLIKWEEEKKKNKIMVTN